MASTTSPCRSSAAESSYCARQERARARRIERARANLSARRVSLACITERPRQERTRVALSLSLSLVSVCHVGIAYATCTTREPMHELHAPTPVRVALLDSPPRSPVPEPEPEPALHPTNSIASKTPTAPRPHAPRTAQTPPTPTPATQAPEPIALVGLTLESTSASGTGPAFAIGSTLAGTTDRVAATPRASTPPEPVSTAAQPATSRNRRAAPRAAVGVHVEPARRLSRVTPEYPPLLERQGIEADVTVRVLIAANGLIESVELVRGATDRAFDEAALAAARSERFQPELHDGTPVATALTYTYRFRITP